MHKIRTRGSHSNCRSFIEILNRVYSRVIYLQYRSRPHIDAPTDARTSRMLVRLAIRVRQTENFVETGSLYSHTLTLFLLSRSFFSFFPSIVVQSSSSLRRMYGSYSLIITMLSYDHHLPMFVL